MAPQSELHDLEAARSASPPADDQYDEAPSSTSRPSAGSGSTVAAEEEQDQDHQRAPIADEKHPDQYRRKVTQEFHSPQWVEFDGPDDPAFPQNWSYSSRGVYTILLGLLTAGSTFGSAVFSATIPVLAEIYGVSEEVMVLGQSLFIAGFAAGPICFGPASEVYGRKSSVMIPYFIYMCFTAATGSSENLHTIFITRFFAGLFASAPVSNTGGAMADLYNRKDRGAAVVVYSLAVVGGPLLAPVVSASIVTSYLSWRWTCWINLILTALIFTLNLFIVPETNANVILKRKARALRFETGNWLLLARSETVKQDLWTFVEKTLTTPLRLLALEPVCLVICTYNAFVYGVLYGLFQAFPIVFEQHRGWTAVEASLPFLAVLLGMFVAGSINITYSLLYFGPRMERQGGQIAPELRLPTMALGAIIYPIGLFWFANTFNSHAANQIVACALVGCGFLLIFQSGLVYLIDCFTKHSASAVAANTILRSAVGAGLPLAIMPMYSDLGIRWATNTLAFIAVGLSVSPFLFYIFGPKLRSMSRTMVS